MTDRKKLEVGSEELRRIHFHSNRRKRTMYWVGFLEGAMSSGRIERAEMPAIETEARAFAKFFNDPDARDVAEDIAHVHGAENNDLAEQLADVINAQRELVGREYDLNEKDRINEFLGFCAGVICDGQVQEREATAIARRFARDPLLAEHAQLLQLRKTVVDALADGVLTGTEAEDIQEWIARLVGDGYSETGLPSMGLASQFPDMISDHTQIDFPRRTFVMTGALRIAPRREIARMVHAAEGIFANTVTKQTDYVIVALVASRDWRATHFGTKIERARELINRGSGLRLVAENAFETAISIRRT